MCRGRDQAAASRRRRRFLRIDHLLDRRVGGLAGGDRQRVALGRAIVRRPKAFLMDEPLGALDTEFRELMCGELRELHDRIDATTVYVTHDQLEAMAMADKIAVMNQGVIEQIGTPQEIYDRPATMFVADFIGSPPMNFLDFHGGSLRRGDRVVRIDGAQVAVPEVREDRAEGELALGRAARSMCRSPMPRGCAAQCDRRRISRHHADRHRRHGRRPGQGAAAVRQARSSVGEPVGLALRPDKLVAVRRDERRRRCPRRCHAGGAPWLRSRSTTSPSASARSGGP